MGVIVKRDMSYRVYYGDGRPKCERQKRKERKENVGNPPLSRILNNTNTNQSPSR